MSYSLRASTRRAAATRPVSYNEAELAKRVTCPVSTEPETKSNGRRTRRRYAAPDFESPVATPADQAAKQSIVGQNDPDYGVDRNRGDDESTRDMTISPPDELSSVFESPSIPSANSASEYAPSPTPKAKQQSSRKKTTDRHPILETPPSGSIGAHSPLAKAAMLQQFYVRSGTPTPAPRGLKIKIVERPQARTSPSTPTAQRQRSHSSSGSRTLPQGASVQVFDPRRGPLPSYAINELLSQFPWIDIEEFGRHVQQIRYFHEVINPQLAKPGGSAVSLAFDWLAQYARVSQLEFNSSRPSLLPLRRPSTTTTVFPFPHLPIWAYDHCELNSFLKRLRYSKVLDRDHWRAYWLLTSFCLREQIRRIAPAVGDLDLFPCLWNASELERYRYAYVDHHRRWHDQGRIGDALARGELELKE